MRRILTASHRDHRVFQDTDAGRVVWVERLQLNRRVSECW